MLADLKKYISDEIYNTPEEKFIKYVLEHCMDERLKSMIIDGIRKNATTLLYENEYFFNFFCGDQHMYDIFEFANSEYSVLLEAYLKCIFESSEFCLSGESCDVAHAAEFYLLPITRVKEQYIDSFKEIKKAIIEMITNKDLEMLLQAAKKDERMFIFDYLTDDGFDEIFIESTDILISDEILKKPEMKGLIENLADCLGVKLSDSGNMYYWNVNYGEFYDLEPDHDLIELIDVAEKIREQLGRKNIESSKPYEDVIRVFSQQARNIDLITAVLGMHSSAKEVLF